MRGVTLFLVLLTLADHSAADNYFSCASDLDDLRRAADNASTAANSAQSACRRYESCRDLPDAFDLMQDGCRSEQRRCTLARNTLSSELSTVESRLRSVSGSCGYHFELDPRKALERLEKELEQYQAPQ